MNEIKIPLSKTKLIFTFIGSVIFVLLGREFILKPQKYVSTVMRSPELITIVGFASVIFSSLCLIYIFYKAFDKKPGLIVNANGIIDNSNFASVGLIEWSEIIGIRTQQVMSTKFILIDVLNPEKFIQKSSKYKASLMRANLKMYGTPLSITSNSLKYNFEKMESLLKTEFEKYKITPNR
ncbi:STM3941 family protein [Flavobacterium sp.]|uniref:STM3941 family protein n=1 Tax=Flavobacterium sp. TaxID=239 RepID=UPI002FDA375D